MSDIPMNVIRPFLTETYNRSHFFDILSNSDLGRILRFVDWTKVYISS